jgi:L-alanine-DL-glutamate epimerase-like enolase superfamily enzyme
VACIRLQACDRSGTAWQECRDRVDAEAWTRSRQRGNLGKTDQIESLWSRIWWKLHYGGRGGSVSLAVSACDIALWDLKARRLCSPLWRLLGGYDPHVPCYAGGIDLEFTLDALPKQTDPTWPRASEQSK